jgi:hypothetical protein
MDQKGIIERHGQKQYSGRINMDFDINDHITVGTNTGLIYKSILESAYENQFYFAVLANTFPPTMGPFTWDGTGHYTARDIPEIWRNVNPKAMIDNPGSNGPKYSLVVKVYPSSE